MAKQGPPEGGITNLFLSALMITLSQAGGSDSMAETELRAKEIEPAASVVGAGEIKVPRLRWLIIGLIFLATLINYIDRLTVSVLAPVITEALKLSNLEYASLGTWFLLAYTISQGVSGRLYDQIGARRGFTLSITVWSRSEEHTSELQSLRHLVCRLLL